MTRGALYEFLHRDHARLDELLRQLAGVAVDALFARVESTPEVPLARHFDGPRAFENIDHLLRARDAARGE